MRSKAVGDSSADARPSAAGALRDLRRKASALGLIGEQKLPLLSARFLPETSEKIELGRKFGGDPPNSANRSWCQKVGQMSRVFQVQATGRFEVEDFAI